MALLSYDRQSDRRLSFAAYEKFENALENAMNGVAFLIA